MRTALLALAAVAGLAGCGGDAPKAIPEPIEGTRWVGSGRVVVAVPDWWSTGATQCLKPVEDTVYVDSGAATDCDDEPRRSEVRQASTVAVLGPPGGYAERLLEQMEPAGEVDGHEVLELDGCDGWIPGTCRRVFAVPSQDVVFAVTIADEADGDYAAIRSSLRILPEGQTTVPLATTDGFTPTWGADPASVRRLVDAVERAGLVASVARDRPAGGEAYLLKGSLLEVDPRLGSPIAEGGTVTITVAG